MKPITIGDLLALPVKRRLRLAEQLWDSIAEVPDAVELTSAQRAELDRRLAAYRANPSRGSPWPEVRKRLRRR
jgi:putative addiction module component (TIGR02574 family)